MKKILTRAHFSALVIAGLLIHSSIYAQQSTYSPSLDKYVSNSGGVWNSRSSAELDSMINNQMNQQMMMNQIMMNQLITEETGRRQIKAGKATTRFTPTPQNSLAEKFAANVKTPTEKQEAKEFVALALQAFNDSLKAKRLSPYDTADANALAFVLCFIAYKDQDPGDARLLKLRESFRNNLLKSPYQQGTSDSDKQVAYEKRAFRTMLAVKAYQLAKKPSTSAADKQTQLQTARTNAESVLKELWSGNVAGIELSDTGVGFGDKGKRIVKVGGGLTTFERNETSVWAEKYAYCYVNNQRTADINCFYDRRKRFDQAIQALGGTNNDLAYAQAVAFKFSYEVFTQGTKLNDKQFRWILNEVQNDVKGSSAFQSMTDEEKQAWYDYYIFHSLKFYELYEHAIKASKNVDVYENNGEKMLAPDWFRESQSDAKKLVIEIFSPRKLDDYELRENGFVKKGAEVISLGKATVIFERSNTVLSAARLATDYRTSETHVLELLRSFDADILRRNGATNDAAWVNALSFSLCYEVYTNEQVKLNKEQFDSVLKFMRQDVLKQESYQALSNKEKQEYYEYVAVEAMLIKERSQQTNTKNEAKKLAEERVALLFKPDTIANYKLTPTGFVKK